MKVKKTHDTVVILDFGSQYTQLIARRVREAKVYCEILPYNATTDKILDSNPRGIILSGGPASVYDQGAPGLPLGLLERAQCPMLGICYGLQLLVNVLGGKVQPSPQREYGYARLSVVESGSDLFAGLPAEIDVWMSHGDQVTALPDGFRLTATTDSTLNATENVSKRLYGVQFHPEVAHTPLGVMIVNNFLFKICGVKPDWSPRAVIVEQVERIKETVGKARVVCGLSGGVDSAVAAALVHQAIGDQLTCIFVDTGLLREGEFESTCGLFENSMDLNVRGIQAGERFLTRLSGVTDPEEKRKIIGNVFIEVFDDEAGKIGDVSFLAQGTLYPDVIESTSVKGPSAVIKSHHNVGGLPENMRLRLIEPLRDLFKDEAREIGRELGVPAEILNRHPFPGPGLAIRIIGEVKKEHLDLLRGADRIVEEELKLANLYHTLWQAFPVLLPVATVGVMGDYRTYERVIAIRAVSSIDGMTADWSRLPHEVLNRISTRLISEVRGINRVVYDITSKPPSTIEWE